MARAVGLDIGTRMIKLVEVTGSPKSFRIQRLAVREVPRAPAADAAPAEGEEAAPFDPAAATAAVVRELFESLKLPKEDVCATFDTGTTISREIVVPFFEPEKIRKVVKFEAEHHLHSQSVDEVVVNWIKTGETKEGSRLTIFASAKDELVQRLAVLRMAGIEPASVDMDITATYVCADALGLFQAHPNALLLDVGAHVTSLMLIVDGKPRTVRSFLLGVGGLPPALPSGAPTALRADDLFVVGEVGGAARAPAATAELEPKDAHQEFVRKLHREVLRSLPARSDAPPTVAYLSGGGALLPEVVQTLQERIGLPVERVNVLAKAECKDPGPDPAFAGAAITGAVGCALRLLGHNPLGTELLQDEFAPTNTFDVVRTAAATAVTLLFLVLLGLNYAETVRREVALKENDRIFNAAQQMFQMAERKVLEQVDHKDPATAERDARAFVTALPRDETRLGRLRGRLVDRHRSLQSGLGLAKEIPEIHSATRVYFELVKALSEVPRTEYGEWFSISKFDCNERKLLFTIETSQTRDFDTVLNLVKKSKYFQDRAKNQGSQMVEKQAKSTNAEKREVQPFEIRFREDD